jgi:hypothetical protein
MRRRCVFGLLLVASALVAGGCGSSNNKGKIEGTKWTSLATSVKGKTVPAGVLQLEFNADGSLVYKAGPQSMTGKYSLGSGDTVVLHLDQPLAGSKTHSERISVNGDRLTMTDSNGTAVVFQRVGSKTGVRRGVSLAGAA